jgi:catechol 2,3-dioxygenase-like lactoylglutathione lyase family enzyme
MGLPNGVHHLAICTKDIKKQIEFYTQVVGMELVALYWMHGVKNTFHGFLKLGDSSSIAFVQSPEIGEIQSIKGVSHAGSPAQPVAAGVMQHVALNVGSEADLLAMRDRVRSHGYWVMGPLDHGFCKSIYLAAPEGIMLEFSTSEGKSINGDAWIDPEVVKLSGITPSDLRRYRNPPAFMSAGGKVAQPSPHSGMPMMDGMERLYKMTDEEITTRLSESTPPVAIPK